MKEERSLYLALFDLTVERGAGELFSAFRRDFLSSNQKKSVFERKRRSAARSWFGHGLARLSRKALRIAASLSAVRPERGLA